MSNDFSVEGALKVFLQELEDSAGPQWNEHASLELERTPKRASEGLLDMLSGYKSDPEELLKVFPVYSAVSAQESGRQQLFLEDLYFASVCAHHLLPFIGTVDIMYIPNKFIVGLSKAQRFVDVVSRRLQLQENLAQDLVSVFYRVVKPHYVLVKVKATHTCISCRGVRSKDFSFSVTASAGYPPSVMPLSR